MKFIIKRASTYNNEAPVTDAFLSEHENWNERTCTERYLDTKFSKREGKWKNKGKKYTITKEGCIARQENDIVDWTIEIDTIEELVKMIEENDGRIIITSPAMPTGTPIIEIDDEQRGVK